MMSGLRWSALAIVAVLMGGCTLSSTVPLETGGAPHAGRAVIVYGLGVEGQWPHARYGVQLAEYSLEQQNITGNCFRFNRVDAAVPSAPAGLRYVAFDVVPGSWVYSPMNGAQPEGDPVAFRVPAGQTVYLGDFIYGKNGRVRRTGDLAAERTAIRQALPALAADLMPVATVPVAAPKPFLCTP
jgi:hypothetical protein